MNDQLGKFQNWANFLQQNHLNGLFQVIGKAASPLRIVISQFLFLSQPFFHSDKVTQLAEILENQQTSENLLKFLTNSDQEL